MKWWIYFAIAAALTVWFGLPFQEYDTESLLPIQTVQAERTAEGVHVVSEVGEGIGATWEAALEDLRANAPGEVFFDTAEQLVVRDWTLLPEILQSKALRPAAQVYVSEELYDPEGLFEFLNAHPSALTVGDLEDG